MTMQRSSLGLCIAVTLLLTACSGGGATRSSPPQASAPPPPAAPATICPTPVTADCVVTVDDLPRTGSGTMTGGRQSDQALIVRLDSRGVWLGDGAYRFAGGTTVESGGLSITEDASLASDVAVMGGARLTVGGVLDGNLMNSGRGYLYGVVNGDVVNNGTGSVEIWGVVNGYVTNNGAGAIAPFLIEGNAVFAPGRDGYLWLGYGGTINGDLLNNGPLMLPPGFSNGQIASVVGNFRQSSSGVLGFGLPWGTPEDGSQGPTFTDYPLSISGRADIEGGALWLYRYYDGGWYGIYLLPTSAFSLHILHADGGVFGVFDDWVSPGLFIDGDLRYESNDIWFDAARVSIAETMAASGAASAFGLASASRLDAALAIADGWGSPSALNDAQRRFLQSASALLWQSDLNQASRSLDSLAGQAHGALLDALGGQLSDVASRLETRLSLARYGNRPQIWSDSVSSAFGNASFNYGSSGIDWWLSPNLLVGASIAGGDQALHVDRLGGFGQGRTTLTSAYLHVRGDDWRATGLLGAGRASLDLQRPIELGAAGTLLARSQRQVDQLFAHGELGRVVDLGVGSLTPFAAMDYTRLHSDAFMESGVSGLELSGQTSRTSQLLAAAGLRYAHGWNLGRSRIQLNVDASRHRYVSRDGALRAAFIGVPDLWFELPMQEERAFNRLRVGIDGSTAERWNWTLDYQRDSSVGRDGDRLQFSLRREL